MENDKKNFFSINRGQVINDAVMRPVTKDDVQAISKIRPYAELSSCEVNGAPCFVKPDTPDELLDSGKFGAPVNIRIPLDWHIQYWPGGDQWPSLCNASVGNQLYYGDQPTFDDEDFCVGTNASQRIDIGIFMVYLARQQKWPAIRLSRAEYSMSWAVWLACDHHSIPLFGFEPTEKDLIKKNRIKQYLDNILNAEMGYEIV